MPRIIDYSTVLSQMQSFKMKCVYYNSAAFAFLPDVVSHTVGYIGPADSSIRPEALAMTYAIAEPYSENLAQLATQFWQQHLPGQIWIAPKSHWAHELQHGARNWLDQLLRQVQIDPAHLADLTNAAAIEFSMHEKDSFQVVVKALMESLVGSDFAILSPNFSLICTIHHHKQLWWTFADANLLQQAQVIAKPMLYNSKDLD